MPRIAHRLCLALAIALLVPACSRAAATAVGTPAPAFSLPDLQGKVHKLADYHGRVVVLEWINPNCPFSRRHAEEGTMTRLAAAHPEVVWLAINSTGRESRDFMAAAPHTEYAREHRIAYPVLYDTDGKVGHAYGASTTPHMFVIDEQGTLVYRGAIDDDPYGRARKRTNYVEAALVAQKAGRAPEKPSTIPYGCSVKY